jgi:hypothetical protein
MARISIPVVEPASCEVAQLLALRDVVGLALLAELNKLVGVQ